MIPTPRSVAPADAGTAAGAGPVDDDHAWQRAAWVFRLLLPVLLAFSLALVVVDHVSTRRTLFAVALSVAMVGWELLLRPERSRNLGADRRTVVWGLGAVVLWMPLVLVHPSFFLVLTGLFTTVFTYVDFPWARGLAGLLGFEIVVANIAYGEHTVSEAAFTALWSGAIVVGSVLFAGWIHGIIDQSRDRHDLIAQLEATRADLATAERAAGIHQERARLTGEIHDTLAQGFTSIVMVLQAAEAQLAPDDAARPRIRLAIESARAGLDDARRLIADLDPAPLDARTLPDAVRRVADRFTEETGVRTEVAVDGAQRRLDPPVEVALLRAVQESLANVRKHAGARTVTIALAFGDEVTLRVTDDGAGFDAEQPTAGYGLRGMRERLATVDGRVAVASEPGSGTRVEVAVP